ncbi:hypothetical protein [Paractinoplanes toevensis]|uniref:Uncharacterized protein n=1 Tax=Paractinoplanes toevensis TaxID=571911 RepID=A0A919VZ33_9ACTN|nr:hypothetical protein [Actinoplanes toevensis]GIM89702.1 hypothetical protein Ato02nite_014950 [Actinoplanes toevensis]
MTYPQPWIDAAAEAAHKALDEVDIDWHYTCTDDPDDQSCGKGYAARAMLVEDVLPAVLVAWERMGLRLVEGPIPGPHCPRCGALGVPDGRYGVCPGCAEAMERETGLGVAELLGDSQGKET